ncbi:PREDICTED: auxin-induced protein 6B-like [Ipomoea nil]|uniref:auxin-induced protein 6B-like n=1 Tax=Ipomoea nil TaxID=35883 RepID=UPI000901EC28|nr:PREDICTED: auxin-induced protein 6B-like [Ipomoea nil]
MLACSKIRHIVKLRQMLRRWRRKAAAAATRSRSSRVPSDVPAGHVAVTVGSSRRRFVVRATYLNHPIFAKLLSLAEEEYGFAAAAGPLAIPCDESVFEEILRHLAARSDPGKIAAARFEDFQRYCHAGIRNGLELFPESRPLLRGENSTC